ncbi:NTP transferase domain-containing protein [Kordiimonas laminariae]|uniref:NTP transferase domain-containing protein n=1 Tax=Kordiimonas laminariae TaxID=2917717 RepID=UPI001FF1EF10|nr:molybdopterin-binding/glycosyltransferase family 2 protein [Kordiimonas laminariae]
MQFKDIATKKALGWHLAHSLKVGEKRIPKGHLIDQNTLDIIISAGISSLWAYQFEAGDIKEDEAARTVAAAISGKHTYTERPTKGRANIFAESDGLLQVGQTIEALNTVNKDFGVATLPTLSRVKQGQLIATVKTIPYAVSEADLKIEDAVKGTLSVTPFDNYKTTLICSDNRFTKKNQAVIRNRIQETKGTLSGTVSVDHSIKSISEAIQKAADKNDLILLLGISAIADIRDVLPAAVIDAGGEIIQIGMPVDPGNLLMLAKIGDTPIIGIPGCAKSPALNGFDFVLERFAAGLPLDTSMLSAQGIGGLLKEIHSRPEPRTSKSETTVIAAITLAAGKSSRAASIHKLLAQMNNKPVLEHTLKQTAALNNIKRYAVTGFRTQETTPVIEGQNIEALFNAEFESGMASSIRKGISALPAGTSLTFIVLGDMPFVTPATYNKLLQAAERTPEAEIFIPTFNGKRGNPVLWRSSMFEELSKISGDKGGRTVFQRHESLVCEVDVSDPGILIDLDTPEALTQFGITAVAE